MRRCDVRTKEAAFAYILDCNLATVASMAMLKSRKKGEYERQINLAQIMLDWCFSFGIDVSTTRAAFILADQISVKEWAKKYEV